MKYKLSICMMVKNEELHLKRCLDSIEDVVKRDDVELIIVDTGSIDDTRAIAEQYTNKVYFKEWFDDFSGMRNVTLSYATGEWIFIIDADETVENIEVFNDFLDNKINESIKTYFVREKNYVNIKNLDAYSMIITPRFFYNDGSFKYEGTVHNQPIYKQPVAYLDIILGHYGYIVLDKKIMDEKFNRTTQLLIKELKKKPDDMYYLFQLATSYNMHGDTEDSYEISKKAYELLMKCTKKQQIEGFAIFSVHLSNCLVLKKYNEVLDVSEKSIKLREDYIDGYFYLLFSYEKLGNLDIAKKYAEKFIDLVERFDTLPISKDDSIAIYRTDRATVNKIKIFLVKYYINRNEHGNALKYLNENKIDSKNINVFIDIYIETNQYNKLKDLYYKIEDLDLKLILFEKIEEKIDNYKPNKKKQIRSLFTDINEDYSQFCRFSVDININEEDKLIIANKIFANMKKNTTNLYYAEVMSFICENMTLNLSFFNKFNRSNTFYYLNYFYNNKYSEVYLKVFDWIKNIDANQPSFKNEVALKNLLEGFILRMASEYKNTGIETAISSNVFVFDKYIQVGLSVINKLYITKGMSLKYEYIADAESKFLILMNLYYENLNNANTTAALKYYKLAAEAYPELADFLATFLKKEFIN